MKHQEFQQNTWKEPGFFYANGELCVVESQLLRPHAGQCLERQSSTYTQVGSPPCSVPSAPAKPALSFPPLSECQRDPHVILFLCPLLGNPGGFRMLQSIAVLIQTLEVLQSQLFRLQKRCTFWGPSRVSDFREPIFTAPSFASSYWKCERAANFSLIKVRSFIWKSMFEEKLLRVAN